jgi:hypothetical protein
MLLLRRCKPYNGPSMLRVKVSAGHFFVGFSQSCGKRSTLSEPEPDKSLDAIELMKHVDVERVEFWILSLI